MFSKCKENLEEGRRLENISWRLWHRSTLSFPGTQVEKKKNNATQDNNLASVFTTLPKTIAAYCPKTTVQETLSTSAPLSLPIQTKVQDCMFEDGNQTLLNIIIPPSPLQPIHHTQSFHMLNDCFNHEISQTRHFHNNQSQVNQLKSTALQSNPNSSSKFKKTNFYDRFTESHTKGFVIRETNDEISYSDDLSDESLDDSSTDGDSEDLCISPESYSAYVARQEYSKTMFDKLLLGSFKAEISHRHHYIQDTPKNVSALSVGLGLIKQPPQVQERRNQDVREMEPIFDINYGSQLKKSIVAGSFYKKNEKKKLTPYSVFDRSLMNVW